MASHYYDDEIPATCPECGRKVIRQGNRHHREVFCSGRLEGQMEDREFRGQPIQVYVRTCNWRASVYYRPNRVSVARLIDPHTNPPMR